MFDSRLKVTDNNPVVMRKPQVGAKKAEILGAVFSSRACKYIK